MQVLWTDGVKCPHQAALQKAEETFAGVHMSNCAVKIVPRVFLLCVIHSLMFSERPFNNGIKNCVIRRVLVGIHNRASGNVPVKEIAQVFICHLWDNIGADFASALYHSNDRDFICVATVAAPFGALAV